MKKMYNYLYALSLILCFSATANAQLILKEDFDYPVGNLEGKNGGTGFTANSTWSKTGTNAAASIGADTKAQILAGSIAATGGVGNRVQMCIDSGKTVRLDRTFAVNLNGADGQNYWLGFWYRSNTDTSSVAGATNTTGIGAQLCLMGPAGNADAWAQRLQFGKHAVGGTVNNINIASRAAGCTATGTGTGATSWGTPLSSKGTYYILVKITKGDTVDAASVRSDAVRMWVLTAPPANEAALASKPNGDVRAFTRVLRADNVSGCAYDGAVGIRLRVEGGGNTAFCAEFDDIRMARTLPSVLQGVNAVKDIAADYFSMELAPNPASDMSMLELKMKKSGKSDIGVFDVAGKRVATVGNGFYTEGVHNLEVKTATMPAGIYFVKMQMENSVQQTAKLVVTK